jgi:hypothetical protein
MSTEKRGRPRTKTIADVADSVDDLQTKVSLPWEEDIFQSKPAEETIKEVVTNFDVNKLSENHKNYIGSCAGLKMWSTLSADERRYAWGTGTSNNYYSHSVFNPGNIPPLLCYKRVGKGYKNEYVINLNSMRPTKTSINQEQVPNSIIKHFLDSA